VVFVPDRQLISSRFFEGVRTMKLALLSLVACLVFVAPVTNAQTRPEILIQPHGNVRNRVYTSATLTDGGGNAVAKVLTGSAALGDGRQVYGMRVSGRGLTPGASYTLVLDGIPVGSANASATGILKMKFATPSKGRVQAIPESVLPLAAVRTATLYNTATQTAVASGSFATVR
jgi:hypothetical protein